jgi:hypothetical protein
MRPREAIRLDNSAHAVHDGYKLLCRRMKPAVETAHAAINRRMSFARMSKPHRS